MHNNSNIEQNVASALFFVHLKYLWLIIKQLLLMSREFSKYFSLFCCQINQHISCTVAFSRDDYLIYCMFQCFCTKNQYFYERSVKICISRKHVFFPFLFSILKINFQVRREKTTHWWRRNLPALRKCISVRSQTIIIKLKINKEKPYTDRIFISQFQC